MYTLFVCPDCGHLYDSEGTPHPECPKCGAIGEEVPLDEEGNEMEETWNQ